MNRVEIKTEAKKVLVGKHLMFLLSMIIYGLISAIPGIGIIALPMSHGVSLQYWDAVKSNKNPQPEDLIDSYRNLNVTIRFVGLSLIIAILTFLWSLLLIIPGIVKSYSYSAAIYVFPENSDTPIMECISKSREIMNGHKMERFVFDLSFIGHFLLCIITCGLWMLYLLPYYNTACSVYYKDLLNVNTSNSIDNVIDAEVFE